MLSIPSTDSTTSANTHASEPSSKSSKAPIIDEEGFITPHPIKAKKTVSTKDSKEPEFRGQSPPESQSISQSQSQSGNLSTPAKKGSTNGRPQSDEIRIGSMHSMNKRPSSSKIPTASIATTIPPSTSNATPDRRRETSTELEHQTDKEAWTVAGLSEPTLSNSISNSMIGYNQNPKTGTDTKTNGRSNKKTRPIIVFDSNNKLSWADEVIEEAEEEQKQQTAAQQLLSPSPQAKQINNSKSTKTHTHPNFLSAEPLSKQKQKTQNEEEQQRQQRQKNPEKGRSRRRTQHANSKLYVDLATTPTNELKKVTGTNRFAALGRSVDCI